MSTKTIRVLLKHGFTFKAKDCFIYDFSGMQGSNFLFKLNVTNQTPNLKFVVVVFVRKLFILLPTLLVVLHGVRVLIHVYNIH